MRQKLSHYQLLSRLGASRMSEVYCAHDLKLQRFVALRLFTADAVQDPVRAERLLQELRSALALQHPHICPIYEIGELEDGRPFVVTEYIAGLTLEALIASAPLEVAEAIEIAIQLAWALDEAHHQGLVHGNLKPANVMITAAGQARVLDFGLAATQCTPEVVFDEQDEVLAVGPQLQAEAVRYLSPEQVLGLAVDLRSDIFSLGGILYCMVTGRAPFEGLTAKEIINSILTAEAPPMNRYVANLPDELERIVIIALGKERQQRYQTATELLDDLNQLKRKLEEKRRPVWVSQPGAEAEVAVGATGAQQMGGPVRLTAEKGSTVGKGSAGSLHAGTLAGSLSYKIGLDPGSRREPFVARLFFYLANQLRRRREQLIAASLLMIVALTTVIGLDQWLKRASESLPRRPPPLSLVRLARHATAAAISPDGRKLAYVAPATTGGQYLWLRSLAASELVQLSALREKEARWLSFSPDGSFLYFVGSEQSGSSGRLYQIPLQSGAAGRLLMNQISSFAFSPDGERIAFIRQSSSSGESVLGVAETTGKGEKILARRRDPDQLTALAFSPQGETIICAVREVDSNGAYTALFELQLSDGAARRISTTRWDGIEQIAWLASGLIMSAKEPAASSWQIWQLPHMAGEARKITDDFYTYRGVSVSKDASLLVTISSETQSNNRSVVSGDVVLISGFNSPAS